MPWNRLSKTLRALKRRWRWGKLERLTVGSRGVWAGADRRKLAGSLRSLARDVEVLSDAELAHRAALGGRAGILVLAGTGSIALAMDSRGKKFRAGGLGPLLGDEGSAFWIGKTALGDPELKARFPKGLALRLARAGDTVRTTAALARRVLVWAKKDKAARAIRNQAAAHLAGLAFDLERRAKLKKPVALSWHGGVFSDVGLRVEFLRLLSSRGKRFAIVPNSAPGRCF